MPKKIDKLVVKFEGSSVFHHTTQDSWKEVSIGSAKEGFHRDDV